jgi:hypothetical protein
MREEGREREREERGKEKIETTFVSACGFLPL